MHWLSLLLCCRRELEAETSRHLAELQRSMLAALGTDAGAAPSLAASDLGFGLGSELLPPAAGGAGLGGGSDGGVGSPAARLGSLGGGFAVAQMLDADMEGGDSDDEGEPGERTVACVAVAGLLGCYCHMDS